MKFVQALCVFVFGSLLVTQLGCGGSEQAPPATTNDINAYLEANPDAREKPEDVAGDEDQEIDASSESTE